MPSLSSETARQLGRVIELVELGARTTIIESLTSASKCTIRKIYHETRGFSPPAGQMKITSLPLLTKDRRVHLSASIFAHLLANDTTSEDEFRRLIDNYKRYQDCLRGTGWPVIELADAWLVMRDWRNKAIRFRYCRSCKTSFLAPTAGHVTCPTCAVQRDTEVCGKCGSRKRGSRCYACEAVNRRRRRAHEAHNLTGAFLTAGPDVVSAPRAKLARASSG
jgi:flagellar transcriptional activator FlhC